MNYARQQRDPTSRIVGIAIVILFHVVLIYAVVTGLGRSVIEVIKGPLETKIIEEVKPPEPPPPPPPPPPKVTVPPPAWVPPVDIQVPVQPDKPVITVTKGPPPPPTMAVMRDPNSIIPSTPARIDVKSGCRLPEYPPAAKRAEEQGTTVVGFLVGADGRVKESKIEASSGSARLDEAARTALSLCHFTPATIDGKPVAEDTWTKTKYTWRLEDE